MYHSDLSDIGNLQEEVLKMQYFKHPNVTSLIKCVRTSVVDLL